MRTRAEFIARLRERWSEWRTRHDLPTQPTREQLAALVQQAWMQRSTPRYARTQAPHQDLARGTWARALGTHLAARQTDVSAVVRVTRHGRSRFRFRRTA